MPQNSVQLQYPFPYKTMDGNISGAGSGAASYVDGTFTGNVTVAGSFTGTTVVATTVINSPYIADTATVNSAIYSTQTNNSAGTSARSGWQSINDVGETLTMLVNSSGYSGTTAARIAQLVSSSTQGLLVNAGGVNSPSNKLQLQSNGSTGFQLTNAAGVLTTTMPQFSTIGGVLTTDGSGNITSVAALNGTVGATTPSTGAFTTITVNTSSSITGNIASYTSNLLNITNNNTNPQGGIDYYAPNLANGAGMSIQLGAAGTANNSIGLGFTYAGLNSTSNSLSLNFFGGTGSAFNMYNSTATPATLSSGLTLGGAVKATTAQLTTNMATAGVLLNDASGNVTSSLGALPVASGGTGVIASYGTGTAVALPPTGGLAGQALVSGAGAGAAMTWSKGQGAAYSYRQGSVTPCPSGIITGITWDTAINTVGQALATNFTYAVGSASTGGTFTYIGANTVAIYVSFTVCFTAGVPITMYINPSSGGAIGYAGTGTVGYTSNCSGIVILPTNGTFNCRVNQTTGGALNTAIGTGVNSTQLQFVVLPI